MSDLIAYSKSSNIAPLRLCSVLSCKATATDVPSNSHKEILVTLNPTR